MFSPETKEKKTGNGASFYMVVHNFSKAYPYALQSRARLDRADSILASRPFTAREKEKFLEKTERELFAEFEAPLRKLTFSQGRMLLRLIDREIGMTSFAVVKNYRRRNNSLVLARCGTHLWRRYEKTLRQIRGRQAVGRISLDVPRRPLLLLVLFLVRSPQRSQHLPARHPGRYPLKANLPKQSTPRHRAMPGEPTCVNEPVIQ